MSNFYFIESIGRTTPDLFPSFIPYFKEQGHKIVEDIYEADIAFVDLYSHLAPMDDRMIGVALSRKTPLVFWDESDYGGMSKEIFLPEAYNNIAKHQKIVYFMRKMSTNITYPDYVFPYEKCLYKYCDFPLTTPEELQSRPYEIFYYGNTSPQRKSVTDELKKYFKCDFRIGEEKIPHDEWLQRARQSKLFLTSDGGGYWDERMHQLITISPMLKQKNNHLQVAPFSDCINCLMVSENPTQDEMDGIKSVLDDKEYLYEIYTEGVSHAKKYYTEQWRANYVLSVLKQEGIL